MRQEGIGRNTNSRQSFPSFEYTWSLIGGKWRLNITTELESMRYMEVEEVTRMC